MYSKGISTQNSIILSLSLSLQYLYMHTYIYSVFLTIYFEELDRNDGPEANECYGPVSTYVYVFVCMCFCRLDYNWYNS